MTGEPPLTDWGVYVHLPFCPRRCSYCDFPIVVGRSAGDQGRYVDAVLKEWAGEALPVGAPVSVYLGGGTPSLLPPAAVGRILEAIAARTGSVGSEVTLEANPGTVSAWSLTEYRAAGVNRLSIGAEALQDRHLRAMNRNHTAAEVREAAGFARAAGIGRVSLDAIYGLPGQSMAEWQETLDGLIALEPEHLSLYQLEVEPTTRLGREIAWGRVALPAEDAVADMADYACERLSRAGLARYEVSSFARPGAESRHNMLYWTFNRYVAVGLGAHAFDGRRRWGNVRALPVYLARVEAGGDPADHVETLSREEAMREYAWLGLRAIAGFSRARFRSRFGVDPVEVFASAWARLEETGLVLCDPFRIRLTARGADLYTRVMAELVDAPPAPGVLDGVRVGW